MSRGNSRGYVPTHSAQCRSHTQSTPLLQTSSAANHTQLNSGSEASQQCRMCSHSSRQHLWHIADSCARRDCVVGSTTPSLVPEEPPTLSHNEPPMCTPRSRDSQARQKHTGSLCAPHVEGARPSARACDRHLHSPLSRSVSEERDGTRCPSVTPAATAFGELQATVPA